MIKSWHLLAASTAAIAIASPAFAQAEATAAPQDSAGLEDIVVTAQKRSENLQDVPIAITAIGGQQLVNSGIENTQDLVAVVPGMTVSKTVNQFQPFIRGIGTTAGFVENPVSLYIDGVYVADQRGALVDLNDIEQVAILKGPQGTLFGRNSTAGVIQITTLDPSHDLTFKANAGYDNYRTLRTDAYVAGGLTEKIAASLSSSYTNQGKGYGENVTTGKDVLRVDHDFSVRGKLMLEPSDATKIMLIGEHFHQQFNGANLSPYPGTVFTYAGVVPTPSRRDSQADANREAITWGDSASAKIDQDLGSINLTSITAYRRIGGKLLGFDADGVGLPYFRVDMLSLPNRLLTQELQLASDTSGPFKWQVGAYYFWNKYGVYPSISLIRPPFLPFPGGATLTRTSTQKSESVAGFGQASWEFLPGTTLTGGIRYTYEKRDFNGVQVLAVNGGPTTSTPQISSLTVKKPTYRIALDHQLNDDVLLYASFNTGFKSGGYNILAPTLPPFLPEKLNAYETGIKTELLDRRVRFNAAAFYYDYSNIQVFQVLNNVSTVSNAAKARVYGLDADITAKLSEELTLSGGVAFLDAKYSNYRNAQIATVNANGTINIAIGDASGKRLPFSQKFAGNMALDYKTEVAGADVHFNATASYQGNYFLEPDNFQQQGSYVLLNSSLRIGLPDGRFSVTMWGRNLFNKVIQTNGASSARGANANYDAAPRTFGLTFGFAHR